MVNEAVKEKTYKPKDEVMVKHSDGTLVNCTYSYFKKHYADSGATIVGDAVAPYDPRAAELEKLLNEDSEE